jgi:hypothetical protein
VTSEQERWRRVEAICQAALTRPPGERRGWLAAACGDDAELLAEVESLLAQDGKADAFLSADDLRGLAGEAVGGGRPNLAGRRLGPYQVVALVGTGGMGEVYRARDTRLDRPVALKVLLPAIAPDATRSAASSRKRARPARSIIPTSCRSTTWAGKTACRI